MCKTALTILGLALMAAAPAVAGQPVDNAVYAELLREHVHEGLVDYEGLLEDRGGLEACLDVLAGVAGNGLHPDEAFALPVNAYNAWTLKLVLDHYPLESVKDIGGWFTSPWDLETVRLGGRRLTLDELEHEIMRPRYDDPRLHMALNCASMSCLKLRADPHEGEKLDGQLDDQALEFVNDPSRNRLEGGVLRLGRIFDWYAKDFGGEAGTGE